MASPYNGLFQSPTPITGGPGAIKNPDGSTPNLKATPSPTTIIDHSSQPAHPAITQLTSANNGATAASRAK